MTGAAGSNSTFEALGLNLIGGGGVGGVKNASNLSYSDSGVQGGSASNGDFNFEGGGSGAAIVVVGDIATLFVASIGMAGSSWWGGGVFIREVNNHGYAATVFGGGGAGTSDNSTGGAETFTGGAGADGVVLIEEYF